MYFHYFTCNSRYYIGDVGRRFRKKWKILVQIENDGVINLDYRRLQGKFQFKLLKYQVENDHSGESMSLRVNFAPRKLDLTEDPEGFRGNYLYHQ